MNSSYCFTVSICEFDFDPALHVVLNENDWRKNWQGLDMFGCLECSSLNRNKHWFFLYFLFFTVGRASSDTCWICGLTVILKDLKSKGQMTPYIPFRAQIACAMLTEQKIQDHLQLRDLLGDRSWWLFLLLVFCGHTIYSNSCISWFFHFFPFPHGGREYTSILGVSRIYLSSHSSDYFPRIDTGKLQLATFCTWCQRTQITFFLCGDCPGY